MLSLSGRNFRRSGSFSRSHSTSFNFKVPQSAIAGEWRTEIEQTTINDRREPRRLFNVSLTFREDGSYLYSVVQTASPRWQLSVPGRYTSNAPQQNLAETVVTLNLTPSAVQFTPTDQSAVQDAELLRLYYEGFPRITIQTLELQSQRQGNLYLRRSDRPAPQVILFPVAASTLRITNSATFAEGPVAPGSLASIFGSFGVRETSAPALPLPPSLAGVAVQFNGKPAPLLYAGPNQINVQVPFDLEPGSVAVTVTIGNTRLTGATVAARTAPAIFLNQNRAIAVDQDFKLNSAANPAKSGSYISVYFTGQGALRSIVSTGSAAPQTPLAYTLAETLAFIGDRSAEVTFSGGAPDPAVVATQTPSRWTNLLEGNNHRVLERGGYRRTRLPPPGGPEGGITFLKPNHP